MIAKRTGSPSQSLAAGKVWYDGNVKSTVYIETSVVSYYTARPSRDLVVAAHQQITHQWWTDALPALEPFTSQLVQEEIARGNPEAAARRVAVTVAFVGLDLTSDVVELGAHHLEVLGLPASAEPDALHLAFATWHGMDYLVSWNCRHIVNARVRRALRGIDANRRLRSPVICTPEELIYA